MIGCMRHDLPIIVQGQNDKRLHWPTAAKLDGLLDVTIQMLLHAVVSKDGFVAVTRGKYIRC